MLWVQVDAGCEWLASVQLRQPAHWWALQLDHCRDVAAQAAAVAGLRGQLLGAGGDDCAGLLAGALGAGAGGASPAMEAYVVSVLAGVMRNAGVFCRCVSGCVRTAESAQGLQRLGRLCAGCRARAAAWLAAGAAAPAQCCWLLAAGRVRVDAAMALGAAASACTGDRCLHELLSYAK